MVKRKYLEVPNPKTYNLHESTWDHYGNYQWTYFSDEVKQRINFFLSRMLHGKNIDVGGGWYLSYPNSTVVDLSSVCLAHNPAKEKFQFDLDELGNSRHLPYNDSSFNSATLISSWQYLKYPIAVTKELERILKLGAEIYIINGQGAGLEKCVVGDCNSEKIQRFFQEQGYDTLIESIPSFGRDVQEFKSVCVAMPDRDLFGDTSSKIKNKEMRIRKNEELGRDPSIFQNAFADWELKERINLLSRISIFPITKYSQEYLERVESFSQEYHKQTGGVPIIFVEHTIDTELLMLTQDYKHLFRKFFLMGEEESVEGRDILEELLKKQGLSFSRHCNYFDFGTVQKLLKYCEDFEIRKERLYGGEANENEAELRRYADFISAIGMNSFTRDLQTQIYQRLKLRVKNLDEQIERQKAFGFHMVTLENKQERRINELVQIKERIKAEGIETVGEGKLDYYPYITRMREIILK